MVTGKESKSAISSYVRDFISLQVFEERRCPGKKSREGHAYDVSVQRGFSFFKT